MPFVLYLNGCILQLRRVTKAVPLDMHDRGDTDKHVMQPCTPVGIKTL